MRFTKVGLLGAGLLVLAGCAGAPAPVEVEAEVTPTVSADAQMCQNLDPAMKSFVTKVIAGEDATAEWKAMNPILMEVEPENIENRDLLMIITQLVAFTISSPTDVGEKLVGTATVDLLAACDAAGSPMVQSQELVDSLTQ